MFYIIENSLNQMAFHKHKEPQPGGVALFETYYLPPTLSTKHLILKDLGH